MLRPRVPLRRLAGAFSHAPALLLAAALALGSSGCATLFRSYDVAPNGLQRDDAEIRSLLASERMDSAKLASLGAGKIDLPEDPLLEALYTGALAHYAGEYSRSSTDLIRANALAEDRYTSSVSRAVFSLVSSDRSLEYEPSETERLLIHYYGALNHLALGDTDGAAVEARRLSNVLDRYDDAGSDRSRSSLRVFFRAFAGSVFEAAREWNDADVAYRKATGSPTGGRTAAPEGAEGTGEVIVLLERGFIAHRIEEALYISLLSDEVDALTGAEEGEDRAAVAGAISARVLSHLADSRRLYRGGSPSGPVWISAPSTSSSTRTVSSSSSSASECRAERAESARGSDETRARRPARAGSSEDDDSLPPIPARRSPREVGSVPSSDRAADSECDGERDDARSSNPYVMKIAWPAFRQDRVPAGGTVGLLESADVATTADTRAEAGEPTTEAEHSPAWAGRDFAPVSTSVDLSDAVVADFEEHRRWVLARTIARATTKLAMTRRIEDSMAEKDETLGKILGALTNAGTALLEQADTRSWHLLPASVEMVRLRLPAGSHQLVLQPRGSSGAGTASGRVVELGSVEVRAGEVSFLSRRIWN